MEGGRAADRAADGTGGKGGVGWGGRAGRLAIPNCLGVDSIIMCTDRLQFLQTDVDEETGSAPVHKKSSGYSFSLVLSGNSL